MALNVEQAFGTGGSPSSGVFGTGQTVTLTSSFAPFALTFSVPSISGKTLGTNGNDYLALNIWTSGGSDYNVNTNSLGLQTIGVDLWGVHIKVGTHTTAATDLYKQPELGPELQRCYRYYQRMVADSTYTSFGVGMGTTATQAQIHVNFLATMRAVPSVASSNLQLNDSLNTAVVVTGLLGTTYIGKNGGIIYPAASSGIVSLRPYHLLANNNAAAFLAFDAEL
jgi:hypothetical protein